eukprot:NODE_628_length_5237_cov_0.539510.p6 type:complete len:119 gc:universal NODE_628_length_5237_cov_0.539510:3642-3998(+)
MTSSTCSKAPLIVQSSCNLMVCLSIFLANLGISVNFFKASTSPSNCSQLPQASTISNLLSICSIRLHGCRNQFFNNLDPIDVTQVFKILYKHGVFLSSANTCNALIAYISNFSNSFGV